MGQEAQAGLTLKSRPTPLAWPVAVHYPRPGGFSFVVSVLALEVTAMGFSVHGHRKRDVYVQWPDC
jgi:hypothetical protein